MPDTEDWSPPGGRPRSIFAGGGSMSWTPPLSASNRTATTDVSALWDEAEALRDKAKVKPKKTGPHGYKPPQTIEEKIKGWAPDVVVSLVHSEVMSLLRFVAPGPDADPASLMVIDAVGTARLVCTLTPPPDATFVERNALGLPSVDSKAKKDQRKSSRNAILAHASDLDLLYMECLGLGIAQNKHVYLLLLAALSLLHSTGQLFKHRFSVPRPNLLSQTVQPMLQVPGHASYPAGHAAQAHGVSNLVGDLLDLPAAGGNTLRDGLIDVANHVANMRVVAGLHYAFDNLAGRALGQSIASLLKVLGSGTYIGWQPYAYVAGANGPTEEAPGSAALPMTPVLTALWGLAKVEIDRANID